MKDARYWIEKLQLAKHPEGGYYRETYRDARQINGRACSTAIYFLLPSDEVSMLHRIQSDEVWHFYDGNALTVHAIDTNGNYKTLTLGTGAFQAVVPARNWFGATVESGFALVGCTVAPGFDFADFEMGERAGLLRQFPQHHQIIERLTR